MNERKPEALLKRVERAVSIREALDEQQRVEAIRTARVLAMAGLPKRRSTANSVTRTLRLGANMWLRVTYAATEGNELPFGADRFVLAGIQHLAIKQDSPIVLFSRVGELLNTFDLSEDGRTLALLRQRFRRISGLSVRLLFGTSYEELDEAVEGEQLFIVRRFSLPTRKALKNKKAGQLLLPNAHPYGVILSADFWNYLSDRSNRLLVPLELLKLFVDRPIGWDYLCFLVARCGAAQTTSEVPHEALIALFRDNPRDRDRDIIRRLQSYHREIVEATKGRGRLNASLVEKGFFPSTGGRPRKRWALRVAPSTSLFGKVLGYTKDGD